MTIPHDVLYKGCKHRIARVKEIDDNPIIKKLIDILIHLVEVQN